MLSTFCKVSTGTIPTTRLGIRRVASTAIGPPIELPISILEAIFKYRSAPALAEVKVPIRAINADMTPTNLEVNRKYAPQFDVVIIKGSGHYPMLEQPEQFNELLADIVRNMRTTLGK